MATRRKAKKKPAKKKPVKKETAISLARSREFLRHSAGQQFIVDLEGRSIAELHRHPLYRGIPLPTLQRWAAEDGWAEKRRDLFAKWQKQIEAKIGDEIIQKKVESVRRLSSIQDALFARFEPADHDFVHDKKCYIVARGGAMEFVCAECGRNRAQHLDPFHGIPIDKALEIVLKVLRVRDDFAQEIQRVIVPSYGGAGSDSLAAPTKPKFTTEETMAAAHAILKAREVDVLKLKKPEGDGE